MSAKPKPIKNIFISAIHQNAGKTTLSLGLYNALKKRGCRMAFMKPVGQEYVTKGNEMIDKDSVLISHVYKRRGSLKDTSPVTIGRGYTRKYIFSENKPDLKKRIIASYQKLIKSKDSIIVEGTGHAGVGSVIDLSNADVASALGSKVVIVCHGGIGRSIDELMLNKALFDLKGVETLGVIVNKVLPEKYEEIKSVIKKGLKAKGVRLLGVIPTTPMLSRPTVQEIMTRLNLKVISGSKSGGLYNRVEGTIVAAMEPYNMINHLKPGTLVITSGDRVDNILVSISSHLVKDRHNVSISGIILTGGLVPDGSVMELLKNSKIPVLLAEDDTYTIAARLEGMTCKIQTSDKDKIEKAIHLVQKHVDVDYIVKHADVERV